MPRLCGGCLTQLRGSSLGSQRDRMSRSATSGPALQRAWLVLAPFQGQVGFGKVQECMLGAQRTLDAVGNRADPCLPPAQFLCPTETLPRAAGSLSPAPDHVPQARESPQRRNTQEMLVELYDEEPAVAAALAGGSDRKSAALRPLSEVTSLAGMGGTQQTEISFSAAPSSGPSLAPPAAAGCPSPCKGASSQAAKAQPTAAAASQLWSQTCSRSRQPAGDHLSEPHRGEAGDTMVSQPPAQVKPVWRNGKFSFAEPEEVPARVEEVPEAPMFHPI